METQLTNQTHSRPNIKQMILCALFAALIAAGAFLRVPVPVCPFTLQTLFVALAGMLLGARGGAISAGLYLFIGLVGIPVFTKGGGIWYVTQPTFGFLCGFVLAAYVTGRLVQRAKTRTFLRYFGAGLAGLAALYPIGLVYFYIASNWFVNAPIGVFALLLHCCLMTLPGDILSCAVCALLAKKMPPQWSGVHRAS